MEHYVGRYEVYRHQRLLFRTDSIKSAVRWVLGLPYGQTAPIFDTVEHKTIFVQGRWKY